MLEITAPCRGVRRIVMSDYVRRVVPLLSGLFPTRRNHEKARAGRLLLEYYWDTVNACIAPDAVVSAMESAGFARPRWWAELGVFSEYTAVKGSRS